MDEPSKWALERARNLVLYGGLTLSDIRNNDVRVALALDAARREVLEEAAQRIENGRFLSDEAPAARLAKEAAAAIRALANEAPCDG